MAERKRKDTRFDDLPAEEIQRAQEQLEAFCQQYGLKPWKVGAGKGEWRELFLRLLGLPSDTTPHTPRLRQRPARTEEEVWDIGQRVMTYTWFSGYDDEGNVKRPLLKKNEAFEKVAEDLGIEPKSYASGRYSNPAEVVRGVFNNKYNKIVKEDKKRREEEDY